MIFNTFDSYKIYENYELITRFIDMKIMNLWLIWFDWKIRLSDSFHPIETSYLMNHFLILKILLDLCLDYFSSDISIVLSLIGEFTSIYFFLLKKFLMSSKDSPCLTFSSFIKIEVNSFTFNSFYLLSLFINHFIPNFFFLRRVLYKFFIDRICLKSFITWCYNIKTLFVLHEFKAIGSHDHIYVYTIIFFYFWYKL